ncbi:MAG: ComEC family competence protein [Rhodospirillaceae bacterium]|nr:ComEC family competence protein [Rhodospirillaceae bacterium]
MVNVLSLLIAERHRWALWLPVLMGLGIVVYFGLPIEPPLWMGIVGFLASGLASWRARNRSGLLIISVALLAMTTGFLAAQVRTISVSAPVLQRSLNVTTVEGRIAMIESRNKGLRLTLEKPRITGLGPHGTPDRVRVTVNGKQPDMVPGDWVRLRASLSPPSPPAMPGGFDFQRHSYFRGIGAVGFSFGPAQLTARGSGDGAWVALQTLRRSVSKRVLAAFDAGSPVGGVAVALMTGERGAIPKTVMEGFRDSGLAHLLAISGLHIGLVAGILFFGMRAALVLLGGSLALRHPVKKWAAAVALIGAFAYAMIAGATVPTLRAFLMVGLVLTAVILDRRGLSMRLVAFAAVAIMLVQPDSLLGASFQLSFAAVIALIAAYEVVSDRRKSRERQGKHYGWLGKTGRYIGGVALTTLIAGAATAPFVIYHFNRLADYGLAANLAAVPLTALWVMPWAVVAFALMSFGLEALALAPMGWGVEAVISVTSEVAHWPGAVTLVRSMPDWGLGLVVIGGLWLCLWKGRWRLFGTAGIAAGLASVMLVATPDVLIDAKGKLLAVKNEDGLLAVSSKQKARFTRDIWLRSFAQPASSPWGGDTAALRCDDLGCLYKAKGRTIALVRKPGALAEDCGRADIIVSTIPVRRACRGPDAVIDRFDLWRDGAHAVWLGGDEGVRIESVNAGRGERPWVLRPKRKSQ